MKKVLAFFLVCSLLLVTGCFFDKKVEGYSQQRIIVTPSGSEVILNSEITTYASLNKSYTETLVDLGFEDNLVVVNKESLYLGDFKNLNTVFDKRNPDIADLIEAKPDVLIIDNETYKILSEKQINDINISGIPLVVLNRPNSVEDVKDELEFLVKLTEAEYGEEMLADFNEKLAKIEQLQQERGKYISGYIQLSENQGEVVTIGSDTFLADVLGKVGVESVFNDKKGYVVSSKEEVARKNPEVFIVINENDELETNIFSTPIYNNVKAVENGNIVIINEFDLMNPNYKCVDWILALEQKIYGNTL